MKKIKNQKGAISLFVVLAMLFFLAFMLGVFSMVSRRNAAQLEAVRETAKIYSSGINGTQLYESMIATSNNKVIPITTPEQLKTLKSIGTSSVNYTINGQLYTYTKGASYMLANDIILNMSEEINGKNNITIYDYMLYGTEYNIDMNNHNIYYELSDGSLWKCIFYHNIGTSTSYKNMSEPETQKSYRATKYSILDNGIDEFKSVSTNDYEFLLTYNYISEKFDINNKKYQRWKQQINPTIKDTTTGVTVTGYSAVHIGISTENKWGGLSLSSSSDNTYLDGSISDSTWYYAVGVKKETFYGGKGIPVYQNSGTDVTASECLLFVRAK